MDPRAEPAAEQPDELFQPGELVAGRYQVLRRVAKGGMGLVYEAEDTDLGGRLALKALRPEVAAHTANLARFRREINLARRVTHPNVCRIYDVGQHSDDQRAVRFLTMELLHGETLSKFLEREGPLDPEVALPLASQILSGLAAAHDASVVHRDFKPSNVILVDTPKGLRAVITDFGLSAPIEEGQDAARLTAAGQLMGTLAYLSPEQLEGKPCTPASDLYSFGCVFYRMMTGVMPFTAGTPLMAALARLNDEPKPPRALRPQIPQDVDDVIVRLLRRDPHDRFPQALDVLTALGLDATRDTTTTMLRPVLAPRPRKRSAEPSRTRRMVWLLLALALAALAARYLPAWLGEPAPPSWVALREPEVAGLEEPAARRLGTLVRAALVEGLGDLALPLAGPGQQPDEELRSRVAEGTPYRTLDLQRSGRAEAGRSAMRLPQSDDVGLRLRVQVLLALAYPEVERFEPGDLMGLVRWLELTATGDAGLPWAGILEDIAARRARLCVHTRSACLEAYLLEARVARYLGRRNDRPEQVERAFALTAEAAARFPGDAAPILGELDLALRTRQPSRVDSALAKLETLPAEHAWAPVLGRALASQTCAEWSTALRLIRDQVVLSTDRYRHTLIRLLIDAQCHDQANEQVRLALEQDPANLLALELRAELALKRGDSAAAFADYQALASTPQGRRNREVRSNLGVLKLFAGDARAAVADFAELNRLYPGDPTLLLNEADARRLAGDDEAAVAAYRQALKLLAERSPSPRTVAQRAQALAQLGDTRAATLLIEELLRQHPNDAQAHYSAALIATLAHEPAKARRAIARARELGIPAQAFELAFFRK